MLPTAHEEMGGDHRVREGGAEAGRSRPSAERVLGGGGAGGETGAFPFLTLAVSGWISSLLILLEACGPGVRSEPGAEP